MELVTNDTKMGSAETTTATYAKRCVLKFKLIRSYVALFLTKGSQRSFCSLLSLGVEDNTCKSGKMNSHELQLVAFIVVYSSLFIFQ